MLNKYNIIPLWQCAVWMSGTKWQCIECHWLMCLGIRVWGEGHFVVSGFWAMTFCHWRLVLRSIMTRLSQILNLKLLNLTSFIIRYWQISITILITDSNWNLLSSSLNHSQYFAILYTTCLCVQTSSRYIITEYEIGVGVECLTTISKPNIISQLLTCCIIICLGDKRKLSSTWELFFSEC